MDKNLIDLLQGGDPITILATLLVFLAGFMVSQLLCRRKHVPTKEQIVNEFLQRLRMITHTASTPTEIRAKQEALAQAYQTIYGFNPLDPLPPT